MPLHRAVYLASRLIYVTLDGTLIPIDRIAEDRPYLFRQAQAARPQRTDPGRPRGRLLWASPTLSGSTHDLTAARHHGVITTLTKFGVACYADAAYQGAGPVVAVAFRRRPRRLSRNQKAVNRNHARNRAPGERAVATLKTWKVLVKLRCCPQRGTAIINAIRVP